LASSYKTRNSGEAQIRNTERNRKKEKQMMNFLFSENIKLSQKVIIFIF
jgi:hypothetical protein